MKRLLALLLIAAASVGHAETLDVAATAVPHAEILEFIKPALAAQGVELKVRVFNDYVQPNVQVWERRLDASYYQTKPYLDGFNASRGSNLVTVVGVHIEPFGGYSSRYKSIAELPEGATVAIPNDVSSIGRALRLLARAGLLTLKNPDDALASVKDIDGNPKQLRFRELESATLPRILGQVDLALINTNYALDAKLDPTRDALVIEDASSPYVNYLVARPDNRDAPAIQKLAHALTSPEVKAFIATKYHGAVLPAF